MITADGERPITHATLWQTALAVCGALQARGVVAGEAIALMLPTGAEYFTAFMGVLLCGCVPVPIYPPAEAGQLEEHVRRHAKLLSNARVGLVVFGTLRRDVCFVAKRELLDQLIPRVFLQRVGALFVARDETVESVASAEAMATAVRAGEALVVFAEGTLTRAPGLMPFHLGGFLAAATAGAVTVPMAIRGTRSALRDGEWFSRRLPILVEVGPPIPVPAELKPSAAALRIRDSTRAFIAARCGEPDTQSDARPSSSQ